MPHGETSLELLRRTSVAMKSFIRYCHLDISQELCEAYLLKKGSPETYRQLFTAVFSEVMASLPRLKTLRLDLEVSILACNAYNHTGSWWKGYNIALARAIGSIPRPEKLIIHVNFDRHFPSRAIALDFVNMMREQFEIGNMTITGRDEEDLTCKLRSRDFGSLCLTILNKDPEPSSKQGRPTCLPEAAAEDTT